MQTIIRFALILNCLGLITSCASVHPTNFYTLSKPLPTTEHNDETTPFAINAKMVEVSVDVPDVLKRPQIVINHKDDSRLLVLEHNRWSSSFEEELKDALTSGINASLKNEDLLANNQYRIAVTLLQMGTYIDDKVTAEFYWQITLKNTAKAEISNMLNCQYSASKTIDNRIESAVKAIQAIAQDLTNIISQQIKRMESGRVRECH